MLPLFRTAEYSVMINNDTLFSYALLDFSVFSCYIFKKESWHLYKLDSFHYIMEIM